MLSFQENEENIDRSNGSPSMIQTSFIGKNIPKNLSSEDTIERSNSTFKIHYLPETSSFYPNCDANDNESEEEEVEETQFNVKEMLMDLSSSFQEERELPTEVINLISPEFKIQPQQCEQQSTEPPNQEDGVLAEEERLHLQREKEEKDSQELIWELMRQEQLELYQMQLAYLQNNAAAGEENGLSEEDMKALQEAMNENNQVIQHIHHPPQVQQQQIRITAGSVQGEEEDEEDVVSSEKDDDEQEEVEDEGEEEEVWDYERLLALGQALGDVKTERWRMRSKSVIESLPQILYSQIHVSGEPSVSTSFVDLSSSLPSVSAPSEEIKNLEVNDVEIIVSSVEEEKQSKKKVKRETKTASLSPVNLCSPSICGFTSVSRVTSLYRDYRCVICMEDFDPNDHLRLLPCSHYFHLSCTAGWVTVSNFLLFH
jgi:hypothetical protein